jgi:hypothetical protein
MPLSRPADHLAGHRHSCLPHLSAAPTSQLQRGRRDPAAPPLPRAETGDWLDPPRWRTPEQQIPLHVTSYAAMQVRLYAGNPASFAILARPLVGPRRYSPVHREAAWRTRHRVLEGSARDD